MNIPSPTIVKSFPSTFQTRNGLFTYRDDSVLRWIRHANGFSGVGNITAINNDYAHTLSESEVLETLKKMEQFGCVTIDNDEVRSLN